MWVCLPQLGRRAEGRGRQPKPAGGGGGQRKAEQARRARAYIASPRPPRKNAPALLLRPPKPRVDESAQIAGGGLLLR